VRLVLFGAELCGTPRNSAELRNANNPGRGTFIFDSSKKLYIFIYVGRASLSCFQTNWTSFVSESFLTEQSGNTSVIV